MPWDGCELWLGEIGEDGAIGNRERVAGGLEESVFQPEWSPDGTLYFVSDRTGWWNLYRLDERREAHALHQLEAEFGFPQWIFGMSTYAFESNERIVCAFIERGKAQLGLLDTASGNLERIETRFSDITFVRARAGRAVFRAGSPTEPTSIISMDLASRETEVLRRSNDLRIDEGYLSVPEAIEFPTEDGLTAHGFYYAPHNRDFRCARRRAPAAACQKPRRADLFDLHDL